MGNPTRSAVHVSAALTNVAVAWRMDNPGVASQVFPVVPVSKSIDAYHIWDLDDILRREAKIRAPGSESAGSGVRITNTTYQTHKFALHHDMPWDTEEEADESVMYEANMTQYLMANVTRQAEFEWAAKNFVAGVWGTDKEGAADADFVQWQKTTSDPIVNIRAFKRLVQKRTGYKVNTATFGADVWDTLLDHPDMIDRVKATGSPSPGVITMQLVAEIMELDRVFVADMVHSTSEEQAATATTAFIVNPRGILLAYAAPSPSREIPSAGYTFSRKGRTVPNGGTGVSVNRFELEKNEATRIEAQGEWDHKIVAPELGLFMDNVIA